MINISIVVYRIYKLFRKICTAHVHDKYLVFNITFQNWSALYIREGLHSRKYGTVMSPFTHVFFLFLLSPHSLPIQRLYIHTIVGVEYPWTTARGGLKVILHAFTDLLRSVEQVSRIILWPSLSTGRSRRTTAYDRRHRQWNTFLNKFPTSWGFTVRYY
jgi:hypothetical protein